MRPVLSLTAVFTLRRHESNEALSGIDPKIFVYYADGMAYQLPPLPWLRAFEAAARHCSFAAAAHELNVTAASVSHQIRALERRLGFSLFERLPRGVKLSDMGAAYVPSVRRAFDELSVATTGLFGTQSETTLRVRLPISYAALVVTPLLPAFQKTCPGINLQLCTTVWGEGLQQDSIDIDIRYGDGLWQDTSTNMSSPVKLGVERSVVVCSPDHAKGLGNRPTLDRICEAGIIRIIGCEGMWNALLQQEGSVPSERPSAIKSDTSLVALEYAAAGVGSVLVLDAFAAPFLKSGRLVQPVSACLLGERGHYLLRRADSAHQPEASLFSEWLMEQLAR